MEKKFEMLAVIDIRWLHMWLIITSAIDRQAIHTLIESFIGCLSTTVPLEAWRRAQNENLCKEKKTAFRVGSSVHRRTPQGGAYQSGVPVNWINQSCCKWFAVFNNGTVTAFSRLNGLFRMLLFLLSNTYLIYFFFIMVILTADD